ncbi:hypothetical protein [Streptomyces sp. NPDC003015]
MPRGHADRNARRYQQYTGIGHQAALRQLKDRAPGNRPIPTAEGAQQLLEGLVFQRLKGDVDYFAHPVGITSVLPATGSLTLTLDASSTRHGHTLAAHALEGLLPVALPASERSEDDPEIIGVQGIRVVRATRTALHLTLVGTSASLILTSAGDTDWKALLDTRHRELTDAGYRPCWGDPVFAEQERDFRAAHAEWCLATERSSWLSSGLLRRVGLLHEVGAAYCTRYWVTWDDWKFELRHDPGVQPPHDLLVDLLVHSWWGMPLSVDMRHCQCDATWADPRYDRECRLELSGPAGSSGTLQLRFRAMGTWCGSRDTYEDLLRAGAAPRWLCRVMPRHHGANAETNQEE